jgi:hypothetical protein
VRSAARTALFAAILAGCSSGGVSPASRVPPTPARPTVTPSPLPALVATEVEPDVFSWGATIVATFQVGRYSDAGASAIGWARSADGGAHWTSGLLGGLTQPVDPHNPFPRASDPVVAYDAAHRTWLINALPVPAGSPYPAAIVSRSPDGEHWGAPIAVAPAPNGADKNWLTCDNSTTSPFYGNCYVEWDDGNELIHVNVSADGGATWGPTTTGGNGAHGLGGQPLVQPNGTVVVPFTDDYVRALAIVSRDGGATWSDAVLVSPTFDHLVATMRAPPLPSAAIDASGTIFLAWADCSFRANCSSNDIVISASGDGIHWTPKARVPIDPASSAVDHFLPGIAVDHATAGSAAHIALTYFFFPQARCTISSCRLYVGYVSSLSGGRTWSAPATLAGPIPATWLAASQGRFVGDYLATTFLPNGLARSVFAVANPPLGTTYDEAMYATLSALPVSRFAVRLSSRGERPYPNAHSDHPPRRYPPQFRARTPARILIEKE